MRIQVVLEEPERVETWVFTFGCGHVHPITGARLERRFVKITGRHDDARGEMFRRFGRKWAHCYATEDKAGVSEFGLLELRDSEALGLLAPS